MAHTPGPLEARKGDVLNPYRTWGVVRVLSLQECQEVDGDEAVAGSRTEIVAEVCAADNGTDEADARLFAAAPELLDALKVFARAFGKEVDNDIEMNGSDTVERVCFVWPIIKRAINKAEGRNA